MHCPSQPCPQVSPEYVYLDPASSHCSLAEGSPVNITSMLFTWVHHSLRLLGFALLRSQCGDHLPQDTLLPPAPHRPLLGVSQPTDPPWGCPQPTDPSGGGAPA